MPQLRRPAPYVSDNQSAPTWIEDAVNAAMILGVCAVVGFAAFGVNALWSADRPIDSLAASRPSREQRQADGTQSARPVALGAVMPREFK
jgi:hypothetical protein